MKNRLIIAVVVCLVLGAWFTASLRSSMPSAPLVAPSIRFVGFTNGVLGAKEPVVTILSKTDPAALEDWFATGTNAAIFTVTNHQSHTLIISANGSLFTKGEPPDRTDAFLLQPTRFPSFYLGPGQEAVIKVAFPCRRAPWKLELRFYTDPREHSLEFMLRSLRLTRARVQVVTPIESDWINLLPVGLTNQIPEPQHAIRSETNST